MSTLRRIGLTGHGSGWVWAQIVLLIVILIGAPLEVARTGPAFALGSRGSLQSTGGLLTLLAVIVLLRAWRDLGRNLTASPNPLATGRLVERGIYRRLRHPMYTGVLLAILGYAIGLGSLVGLAGFVVAAVFFFAKSVHEERLLVARYPAYDEYRRRVRHRFIPGVL